MNIVIMDNEPRIRNGLSRLLDGRGNWHVTGIYADAMNAFKNVVFYSSGVIITDIKVPEISGSDMISRMRETDREAYIIILNGHSDFGFVQRAIKLGVTRYLTKPTKRRELLRILEEIEGKMPEERKGGEEKKEVSNLVVQKAMDYIAPNYSEKINLRNIAGGFYLFPNYLSELFKHHTDKNISEYIMQFHLDKARRYLQQPEYKTADVSDLVDFGDPRYFNSMFRRQYDAIPSEYRNRNVKQLTKQQI